MLTMSGAPVRPGDVLAGKYRVERVLGAGNMGVVLAATHVDLGQLVALKLMLPEKTTGTEQRERFLREARAAVRLRSQHVTRVFDVGTHLNAVPYIAMEFLDGQDLAAVLHERGRLPFDEAAAYVLQACEAVGEAHAAGIVHRDLKPANLFLTKDVSGSPCIKVLDFGVSKLAGDLTLTNESQALGSPLYMSPEQMNSSQEVDARSDLWAIGVILYQLVAGWTPFHADTIQALCTRVFFGQPTPLSGHRSDIPPGFEAVILRCLERERERRWSDVAELAAALAPYAPGEARVYAERVSRVLRVKVMPTPSAPELPQVVLVTEGKSTPVAVDGAYPAGAGVEPPTKTALMSTPFAWPPVAQTAGATAPLESVSARPTAPSTPGAHSDISHALASTKNAASSAMLKQPADSHRRSPFFVAGIILATVLVAIALGLGTRGERTQAGPMSGETLRTTTAARSVADEHLQGETGTNPPPQVDTPPLSSGTSIPAASAAANPSLDSSSSAPLTNAPKAKRPSLPKRRLKPADMYDNRQ